MPKLKSQTIELEKKAALSGFWDDKAESTKVMRNLGELRSLLDKWDNFVCSANDLVELSKLIADEKKVETDTLSQLKNDLIELEDNYKRERFKLEMKGEYDKRVALLSIKSGAGGVDAQDWSSMLVRMYLRFGEQNGFVCEVVESVPGEKAGTKDATIRIDGSYAYGFLKTEKGIHRLVRLSPFDSNHKRHTSFALVEVMPEPTKRDPVQAHEDDLHYDFFKASGHGGQSVQKNLTAVRVRHLPSGIVVSVQNERSQMQNKLLALKILNARLIEMNESKRRLEERSIKGEHKPAEFGNQTRSYVAHPYQLVKDHRTGHQESDLNKVLDGYLNPFIRAALENQIALV